MPKGAGINTALAREAFSTHTLPPSSTPCASQPLARLEKQSRAMAGARVERWGLSRRIGAGPGGGVGKDPRCPRASSSPPVLFCPQRSLPAPPGSGWRSEAKTHGNHRRGHASLSADCRQPSQAASPADRPRLGSLCLGFLCLCLPPAPSAAPAPLTSSASALKVQRARVPLQAGWLALAPAAARALSAASSLPAVPGSGSRRSGLCLPEIHLKK